MNFIDICSGIGGFRTGLENNGHKCLAYAEIDKFAKKSYKAIYNTESEEDLNDITTVTDEHFRLYRGHCDIITGGFPCQTFSIAGNRRGFEDTRGTIFFHIARAIKEIKLLYVLMENVKGLLSHNKGQTFGTIIQALDELGYVVEWQLFNSKYWGVPQNRERVYILVTRKDIFNGPKLFDLGKQQQEVKTKLVDVLENNVDPNFYLPDEKTRKLVLNSDLSGRLNLYDYRDTDTVHSTNKVSPTLNTMQGGDRQPKIAVRTIENILESNVGEKYFMDNPKALELLEYIVSNFPITQQTLVDGTLNDPKPKNIMNTVTARYDSGVQNIKSSGGLIVKPVLTPDRINKSQNGRRFKSNGEPMFTLTSQDRHGVALISKNNEPKAVIGSTQKNAYVGDGKQSPSLTSAMGKGGGHVPMPVYNRYRIRKLTPLECWRLQGFTDEQFYKAQNAGLSNSQLYKQAGNAVTVNVVEAIAKVL